MTERMPRINELIQQQVAKIIEEEYETQDVGLVTVSKVETTNDLRDAKVWVSVLGHDEDATLKRLRHDVRDIQGDLAKRVFMYRIPKLHFRLDTSLQYVERIEQLLREEEKGSEKHHE